MLRLQGAQHSGIPLRSLSLCGTGVLASATSGTGVSEALCSVMLVADIARMSARALFTKAALLNAVQPLMTEDLPAAESPAMLCA